MSIHEALSLASAARAAAEHEHQRLAAEHATLGVEHTTAVDAFTANPTSAAGKEVHRARDAAELAGHALGAASRRLELAVSAEEQARAVVDLEEEKIRLDTARAAARVPVLVAALAPAIKARREAARLLALAAVTEHAAVDAFTAAAAAAGILLPFGDMSDSGARSAARALARAIVAHGTHEGAKDAEFWHATFDRIGRRPPVGHVSPAEWWSMLLAGVSLDDINSETARRFTDHSAAAFAKATDDATDPVHRAVRAVRELLAGRESGVWASAGREEHAIQLIVNAYPAAWTAAESLSTYKYLVGSAAHEIPIPQARTREARTAALLKLADVGLTLAEVQRRAPPIPPVPPGGLVQLPGVRTTDPQAEALATSAAA